MNIFYRRWTASQLALVGALGCTPETTPLDAGVDARRIATDAPIAFADAPAVDASLPDAFAAPDAFTPCPDGVAPTILSPAMLQEGVQLTLSGCRFGTPTHAAPLIWDDFEGGVRDEELSAHSMWQGFRPVGAFYRGDDAYAGNLAAGNLVTDESSTEFRSNYQATPLTNAMYLSYMLRADITGDRYGVFKLSRITSNYTGERVATPHYNGPGNMTWTYQPDSHWSYTSFDPGADVVQRTTGETIDTWHRIEMFIRASTPGVADGAVWAAQDGERVWTQENVMTRAAGMTYQYNSILLGLMAANVRNDGHFELRIDDVMAVSSEARVELGNAPRFEDCTLREIQPYAAWTATSIQVTPRLARLDASMPLYLFVVDPEGHASEGFAVRVAR